MEPGIKKLTEAVKRDCREGQGCFNPNGCDHEFIRHVPETDPSMIRLGQKTKCIKVSSRFGEDDEDWKFVCPSCGHVQSVADFKAIGVDGNKAYYECISRYKYIDGKTNKKPCKYTLCGLIVLDHDTVINNEFLPVNVFKMADVPGESKHTD